MNGFSVGKSAGFRQVNMIGTVCILATVTAAAGYAVFGIEAERARLTRESEACRTVIAEGQRIRDEYRTVLKFMTDQRQEAEQFGKRIPDSPGEAALLAELTDLSRVTGVSLHEFRPGTPRARGALAEIPVTVSVTADYEAVCRFLDSIENLPRLVRLDSLRLALLGGGGGGLDMRLQLHVYCRSGGPLPDSRTASGSRADREIIR